jgi:hypothetical protein
MASAQVIPVEIIERKIYLLRGSKVMLDSDLAELYQVPTKRVNEAVRRNPTRFPADFMFQLSAEEFANLKPQIATSSLTHGGRRKPPYAFTEHGVAMLSSVLTSERAVELNILIIRAFVRLREYLWVNREAAGAGSGPVEAPHRLYLNPKWSATAPPVILSNSTRWNPARAICDARSSAPGNLRIDSGKYE